MTTENNNQYIPESSDDMGDEVTLKNRKRKSKILAIGGGVAALILMLGYVLAVTVFDIDLLRYLGRLIGTRDTAAEAMPTDVGLYFGIDLLEVDSDEMSAILDTFAHAAGKEDEEEPDSFEDLDELFEEEFGVSFSEDIQPWVGRYIGFGLRGADFDFILAIQVSDADGANAFIQKVIAFREESSGDQFETINYEGETIYVLEDAQDPVDSIAMALSGKFLLMAMSQEILQDSIGVIGGDSLASKTSFRNIIKQLPGQRILTIYINVEEAEVAFASMNDFTSFTPDSSGALPFLHAASSVAFSQAGLQIDFVATFDEGAMTESQLALLEVRNGDFAMDEILPKDTFFFVGNQRLDLSWQAFSDQIRSGESSKDFEDSLASFEEEAGFHPDDFFALLDGDYVYAFMPTTQGIFGEDDIPLGLLILLETSNEAGMQEIVDLLAEVIRDTIIEDVIEIEVSDMSLYDIGGPGLISGEDRVTYLVYGAGRGFGLLATGQDVIEETFDGEGSLAEAELYAQTWQAFPSNYQPTFYLDLDSLLDLFLDMMLEMGLSEADFEETVDSLRPITVIALGNGPVRGMTTHSRLVIFINIED